MDRRRVAGLGIALLIGACGQSAPAVSTAPAGSTAPPSVPSATASPSPNESPSVTLIDLADTLDPAAAAAHEMQLARQIRTETGMPALIGPNGESAFADLERIEQEYAEVLLEEIGAAMDAGTIPSAATSPLAGRLASIGGMPNAGRGPLHAIDVSLFADTGFTTSALMSMFAAVVQQAAQNQSGTIPRSESKVSESNGLRQQVDMSLSYVIRTGGGRVSLDIIMAATDSITDIATGSFVALYTSRSTAHFDVNACPDENGVGEGKYTFETEQELNDVSTAQAARTAGGRSVEAPFRLINGENAYLIQIEAALDMQADGKGPGTPGGPGPTAPFDWGATHSLEIVMPAKGPTTTTGTGWAVTGTGGERASGAMLFSSAMAQLFLKQVGTEAQTFWRKGECIEIKTSEESRKVSPGETVEFDASAVGKFDQEEIEAPIKGEFSGKENFDPSGAPVDPPASFTFTAGSAEGDKGTINLEQVGVRGIGKKTVEFTVAPTDYRVTALVPGFGGYTSVKCDGLAGPWVLDWSSVGGGSGTTTFTLDEGGSAVGPAVSDFRAEVGGGSSHWKLQGTANVTQPEDAPPILHLDLGRGTVTVSAGGRSLTTQTEGLAQDLELEVGDFCD